MSLEPTLRPTLTQSASRMLRIREVSPSPLSLASQHLQTKLYMTPLVGTTMVSSSTSQQLSGVAPSCPTCENQQETTCLLKGISSETPIGCFNQWWRAKSVDYIHRHTNHFCGGTEGAVKSFMPSQQARHQRAQQLMWARKLRSSAAEHGGRLDTASPKRKRGRLNWPTWKHVQSLTTLLLFHWSPPASLLISAGPFLHLSNPSTAVAMLRSDYPKLRSQYERCSYANTHMYYSSAPSLTNPHLSQLYVSSCFSASHLLKLQKLHVCVYRSQQMELTSVSGWFSTTTSPKLKNGPPWRAGSHTRVGESLHRWKKGSWQNLNRERKNARGGSRDRGPGEIRRHCPSVQGWG